MERSRVKVKATIILLLAFSVEIASRALDNDSSSSQKPFIASRQENLIIDLKNGSPSNHFEPVKEFPNPLMENLLINAIKSSAAMVSQIEGINKYAIMLNSSDRKKVNVKLLPSKISSSYRENTKAEPKNLFSDSETSSTKIDAISNTDILSNSILRKRQENSKKFLETVQNKTGESHEIGCNCSKNENSSHVHEYETKISTEHSLNGDVRKNSITNELQREIAALNVFTKLTEFEQSDAVEKIENIPGDSSFNDIKTKIVKKVDEGVILPIENLFNVSKNNKFSSVTRNVKDSPRLNEKNVQSSNDSNSETGNEIKNLNLNNESDSRGKSKYNVASVKVNKAKFSNNTDQLNSSQNVESDKNKLNSEEKENYPDLNLFKKAVNEAVHRFASHKVPDFLLNANTEADESESSTYESTTLETTTTLIPNSILDNRGASKSSKSISTKAGGFLLDDLVASGSERPRITQSDYDLNNIRVELSDSMNVKNPKRLESTKVRDSVTHPAYLRKVTKVIKRPTLPLDNVDLTTDSEYSTTTIDISSTPYVDFTTIAASDKEITTKKASEFFTRGTFSSRSSTTSPITYVKTITNIDRGNRGSIGRHSLNAGFLNISDSINESDKTNVIQDKFEKSTQRSQSTTRRGNTRLFTTTIPTTTENFRTNRIPNHFFTTFSPYNVRETTTQNAALTPFESNIKYSSKTVINERGNKKYVPSKFETISPFFSDSHVQKIYSETGEPIETSRNPELEKDRGAWRFINYTGEGDDSSQNTENSLRNGVTNINRGPINLRTQATFSSFNENSKRINGQSNTRLDENSSSSGEFKKFTSDFPSRGRTQNQFPTTTTSSAVTFSSFNENSKRINGQSNTRLDENSSSSGEFKKFTSDFPSRGRTQNQFPTTTTPSAVTFSSFNENSKRINGQSNIRLDENVSSSGEFKKFTSDFSSRGRAQNQFSTTTTPFAATIPSFNEIPKRTNSQSNILLDENTSTNLGEFNKFNSEFPARGRTQYQFSTTITPLAITLSSSDENSKRINGQSNILLDENSSTRLGEYNKFTSDFPTRGRIQNQFSTTTTPFATTLSSSNENSKRIYGQSNIFLDGDQLTSLGEFNKFSSDFPTGGRSQYQFSTTTIPFTTRTFVTTTNPTGATDSFTTESSSLDDTRSPQRNKLYSSNYQENLSTSKPYISGNNQELNTSNDSKNSYQNLQENVKEPYSSPYAKTGNVYFSSKINQKDIQPDSLNSGSRSQFSLSSISAANDNFSNRNENKVVSKEQSVSGYAAVGSQFSSDENNLGRKPFVSDSVQNINQNKFIQQSDNLGSFDKNTQQTLSTYNTQNFQNNLKQQSFGSFGTFTTQTPLGNTENNAKIYDLVTKSADSFVQFNIENSGQNKSQEAIKTSLKPNLREKLDGSTERVSSPRNTGGIQNENENLKYSNIKFTTENSNTRGNLLLGSNQESSTVKSNFNYVANNINLSLNPTNIPTRSSLVPGESGFDETQSGKSTLFNTDNQHESSTEYRNAFIDKKSQQNEFKLSSGDQNRTQLLNIIGNKNDNSLKIDGANSLSNGANKAENFGGTSSGFAQSNLNYGVNDNNSNFKINVENTSFKTVTNAQNFNTGGLSSIVSQSNLNKRVKESYNNFKTNEENSSNDSLASAQNTGKISSNILQSNSNNRIGNNNFNSNLSTNGVTDSQKNNIAGVTSSSSSILQSNLDNKVNSNENNLKIGVGNSLLNGVTNSQNYNIGGSSSTVLQSNLYNKTNDLSKTSLGSTSSTITSQSNFNTKSSSLSSTGTNLNLETRNRSGPLKVSENSKTVSNTLRTQTLSSGNRQNINANNPVNSDLQHGESSSDKLASSFIGKQSDKPNQFSNIDPLLDLDGLERGSKKYTPTKFETISPYLTDSHFKNLYIDNGKSQPGKTSNTIKYNEGTLTIEEGDASSRDSSQSGSSKTTKHQFRGNVKYQWNPNSEWYANDQDFPSQFSYNYNTPEGIMAYQKGTLREINSQKVFIIKGSYQYTAPDGSPIIVNYTADEHGFHPEVVTPAPIYAQQILSKSNVQADEVEEKTV